MVWCIVKHGSANAIIVFISVAWADQAPMNVLSGGSH